MSEGTQVIEEPTGRALASTTLSLQVATALAEASLPLEAIACLAALAIGEGWQSLRALPITGAPFQDQPEISPKIIELSVHTHSRFVRDPINKHWAFVRREFRARAGRDLLKALAVISKP
jgi:hypothetical protein